jgi:cold shock CspA family protein
MQETVEWFNSANAFGFIATADGSKDVFVHQSELIEGALAGGDRRPVRTGLATRVAGISWNTR